MKKINYLIALIATVLVLGTTSCGETSEDPTPIVDELTLSDFDGVWNTVTTTYDGTTYNASTVCAELTSVTYFKNLTLDVPSSGNVVKFTDVCGDFDVVGRNWTVEFDSETQVITVTGSGDHKYEIIDYNLTSSPKTLTLELIDNGAANSLTEGLRYSMVKQ